jgi:hypothetical protein
MDKAKENKQSKSSIEAEEHIVDNDKFESPPEVMGPTRPIGDIIATNSKT